MRYRIVPLLLLGLGACDPTVHARGVVRDTRGAPVAGATVTLALGTDPRVETGRTDSAGHFALTRFGRRSGPVQLRVCRAGYRLEAREWAAGDADSLVIVLAPAPEATSAHGAAAVRLATHC